MSTSDQSIQQIEANLAPHLWLPQLQYAEPHILYQLHLSALRNREEQGNCKVQNRVRYSVYTYV